MSDQRSYAIRTLVTLCAVAFRDFHLVSAYNLDTRNPIVLEPSESDSMMGFGFSVTLHPSSTAGKEVTAIVGAPNGTQRPSVPGVERPGAVYRCSITAGQRGLRRCSQLQIDTQVNMLLATVVSYGKKSRIMEQKSYMALGESVQSGLRDNKLVVCAPRFHEMFRSLFHNESWNDNKLWDPVGRCYVIGNIEQPANYEKLQPCLSVFRTHPQTNRTATKGYVGDKSLCNNAGQSLALGQQRRGRQGDNRLMIGAPGSTYSRGIAFGTDLSVQQQEYRSLPADEQREAGLAGYSVAQGYFTADSFPQAVFAAPKEKSGVGQVFITPVKDDDASLLLKMRPGQLFANFMWAATKKKAVFATLTGTQLGEFFGYSLCAQDVDGDGKDELFVGAPMYTKDLQKSGSSSLLNGRVYIYTKLNLVKGGVDVEVNETIAGMWSNGHFGMTIAALGDIDQDYYNDIAVGAPFEQVDGVSHGAVYIYVGSRNGLLLEHKQKLTPSLLNRQDVTTFGFSISRGHDIDNNQYNDILIGAPQSNTAVAFRARPVVNVTMFFSSSNPTQADITSKSCPHNVSSNQTCVRLWVCGRTSSAIKSQTNLVLLYDLTVTSSLELRTRVKDKRIEIRQVGENVCHDHIVYLKGITHVENPCENAMAMASWRMQEEESTPDNLTPVIRETSRVNPLIATVTLLPPCQSGACHPDLAIKNPMIMSEGGGRTTIIAGLTKTIQLSFAVRNKGRQLACKAGVDITLPTGVVLESEYLPGNSCIPRDNNRSRLHCALNTFAPGSETMFKIDVNVINIAEYPRNLDIVVKAGSFNKESNDTLVDNTHYFYLEIHSRASVFVYAQSQHSNRPLDGGLEPGAAKTLDDVGPNISHKYSVFNDGPSSSPPVTVSISWPLRTSGDVRLLYLTAAEYDSESSQVRCNHSAVLNSKKYMGIEGNSSLGFRDIGHMHVGPSMSTEVCAGALCEIMIHCQVPELKAKLSATIQLTWRVWAKPILNAALVPYTVTTEVSIVDFEDGPYFTVENRNASDATAVTILTGKVAKKSKSLELWKIIVPIVAGVLLLLLLLLILYKVGFFKRKNNFEHLSEEQEMQRTRSEV